MKKKKTKRTNPIKDAISYLKESSNHTYLIIAIFFFSAIIGFGFSENFSYFDEILKELASKVNGLGTIQLAWFIFKNNISSSFIGMMAGVILGIFPIFTSLFNGLLLGYVYFKASSVSGFGIIWLLIPHGIFELPAIFISLGMGVRLGTFIFAKEKKKEFFRRLKKSLITFLIIVMPLLIIAAVVEALLINFV